MSDVPLGSQSLSAVQNVACSSANGLSSAASAAETTGRGAQHGPDMRRIGALVPQHNCRRAFGAAVDAFTARLSGLDGEALERLSLDAGAAAERIRVGVFRVASLVRDEVRRQPRAPPPRRPCSRGRVG